MKSLFKTIALLLIITTSCNNDNNPSPNDTQCNYQGFTFLDTNNNTQMVIPETDLTTDFFNTSSNGLEVEIYQTSNPGDFNFTTTVTTLNATGTGTLNYNGNTYTVNVTCQRTGTAVGEEMRYDVTASGLEVEFCVIIDIFH
ncbi:MAG: hypothetical protein ACWA42_09250 [Lutibacter sp.]